MDARKLRSKRLTLDECYAQQGYFVCGAHDPQSLGPLGNLTFKNSRRLKNSKWTIVSTACREDLIRQLESLGIPSSFSGHPFFYKVVALD